MAWHYYNANREKVGPITSTELKQLVRQGTVTLETFVEDPTGRTGLAPLRFAPVQRQRTIFASLERNAARHTQQSGWRAFLERSPF